MLDEEGIDGACGFWRFRGAECRVEGIRHPASKQTPPDPQSPNPAPPPPAVNFGPYTSIFDSDARDFG